MLIKKNYPYKLLICILILIPLYLTGMGKRPRSLTEPEKIFENYSFSKNIPVEQRVKKIPDFVLNYVRNLDKKDDYSNYIVSPGDHAIIKKSIEMLPPGTKKIMDDRLIGIFFVNNFLGSGFADWVLDKNNNFYVFFIFNPLVLKKDISHLLTDKEKTCFVMDDPSYDISMESGRDLTGFFYILLHESAHLMDYVLELTPYTEEEIKIYREKIMEFTPVTMNIWRGYGTTFADYPFRKDVTFYGFNKGPRIPTSRAPETYRELSKSPFTTLYGSMNWTEDLAELLTFYHITEVMKKDFIIRVMKNGKEVYRTEPMKNPMVRKRFPALDIFYR